MAAPERFAEMSDSSCTAGAVHTWHFSDLTANLMRSVLEGKADLSTSPADFRKRPRADIGQTLAHTANQEALFSHAADAISVLVGEN